MGEYENRVRAIEDCTMVYGRPETALDIAVDADARVAELEAAIRAVLADEESGAGGWGPDVTMVNRLRDALGGA